MKYRVLFICIHNSARSQIAEALLRRECGDYVEVESAGLEPGALNPLAVDVLKEIGIDITGKSTRDVFDVYRSGARFTHVISVCDAASAERCPVFPGSHIRLNWSFADPSSFTGSYDDRLTRTRTVRDEIEREVRAWCAAHCAIVA